MLHVMSLPPQHLICSVYDFPIEAYRICVGFVSYNAIATLLTGFVPIEIHLRTHCKGDWRGNCVVPVQSDRNPHLGLQEDIVCLNCLLVLIVCWFDKS